MIRRLAVLLLGLAMLGAGVVLVRAWPPRSECPPEFSAACPLTPYETLLGGLVFSGAGVVLWAVVWPKVDMKE